MFFRGPSEIVADFGCGEAVIAQSVQNTVYSFDLVAKNKHVTACNMAKVGASKQTDSWGLTSLGLYDSPSFSVVFFFLCCNVIFTECKLLNKINNKYQ